MKRVASLFNLSSADEIDASNAKAAEPKPRAGSAVPSFAESVVHKGAEDALAAICAVMGFPPGTGDVWLKGPDGATLRNALRRFVMHGNASAMESEK